MRRSPAEGDDLDHYRDLNRSPTFSTSGEKINVNLADLDYGLAMSPMSPNEQQSHEEGGFGSGERELGQSKNKTEANANQEFILCDHEMCREKFGKVEVACFYSKTDRKTYCMHCWGLVGNHRPHNIVMRDNSKRKDDGTAEEAAGREGEEVKTYANPAVDDIKYGGKDFEKHPKQIAAGMHKGADLLGNLNEKYIVRAFEGLGIKDGKGGGEVGRAGDSVDEEDVVDEYELTCKTAPRTRTGYRDLEGVPSGGSKILIEEKDRFGLRDSIKNGVHVNVYKGRNYMNDGSWQPPTFHPSAKVKISYMNEETNSGVGGRKQKFSTPVLKAAAATRKRNREIRALEKLKRTGGADKKKLVGGSSIKSQAGRGKDPLVLECKSMSATGLKAGGAGYAPPDFAVPMTNICRTMSLDLEGEDVVIDEQLSKMPVSKEKIVKIVHGVPVVFRDLQSSMSAAELRSLKRANTPKTPS